MTPKPHHALDYAIGIARVKQAVSYCKLAPTPKGSFYSDRFKKQQDFSNFQILSTKMEATLGDDTFEVEEGDTIQFYTDVYGKPHLLSIQKKNGA